MALKRGRDWHGWAFWHPEWQNDKLSLYAEADRPKMNPMATGGHWVRVKFVKVEPKGAKRGKRKAK